MDRNEWMKKFHAVKIPLAAMAAGILLLLIAGRDSPKAETPADEVAPTAAEVVQDEETRLRELLQEIAGVGEARVLLSYETTAETEYVSDGEETVIISAGSGKQSALVRLTRYPRYQGAVVVCEGGDSDSVCMDVVQAVSRFTGLRADRITVLKLRT